MIFYYSRLSLDSIYICLYIYSHKYTFRSLLISVSLCMLKRLPRWLSGKESACQCRRHRDVCLIPEMGRFPGVGNGNPLQYSCLEIPWIEEPGGLQSMGSQRGRSDWSHTHTHTHTHGCYMLKTMSAHQYIWPQSNPMDSFKLSSFQYLPLLSNSETLPSIVSNIPHLPNFHV